MLAPGCRRTPSMRLTDNCLTRALTRCLSLMFVYHACIFVSPRKLQRLRTLAKAADAISIGDTVDRQVRRHNQWGLMPFGAMMGAVVPATYMRGSREIFNEGEMVRGESIVFGVLWLRGVCGVASKAGVGSWQLQLVA